MGRKIYKYFGPELAGLVLSDEGATFKCSRPSEFNDPYELFLTVDFSSDARALATYSEMIGTLPQLPTTCFSKSPAVIPMWAHYGKNVEGFVIELDEDQLRETFRASEFNDIAYQDQPSKGLTDMLYRAHDIGKPRYTYFLRSGVLHAAYFTKSACWSYEQERRMVAGQEEVRGQNGLLLIDIPKHCITALIAGARADTALLESLTTRSKSLDCSFFQMKIGRSSAVPFFLNEKVVPHFFDGKDLALASDSCENCNEPISSGKERCSWCLITDFDRAEAANRNPYRILHRVGNLESYVESMDRISERLRPTRD